MESSEQPRPTIEYESAPVSVGWARIGPFRDLLDANLAKAKLEDEGISVEFSGENASAALGPIYAAAYGGLWVLVRQDDESRAREIIAELERIRRERMRLEIANCPHCGQNEVDRVIPTLRWIAGGLIVLPLVIASLLKDENVSGIAIGVMVLGFVALLIPTSPNWRCRKCAVRFVAPVPEPPDMD